MTAAWLARFRILNLRHLTAHRMRSALAVALVALSVALLVGLLATYHSLAASVERFGAQVAGEATLEVSGLTDGGFDEALLARVSADPDVVQAVPIVRSVVSIAGHRVVLLGIDQRITTLGSSLLDTVDEFPSATRLSIYSVTRGERNEVVAGPGIAATAGLRPGEELTVTAPLGATAAATLFSTVEVDSARALNDGYWTIANLRTAQRLTGRPDQLDSLLLITRPGADVPAVQQRLLAAVEHRAVVAPPQFRVAQASDAASLMRNMTLFVAAVALAVVSLLVYNTFSVSSIERRSELATIRALGGRRLPAARDFLAEAALVGIAGWLVGVPVGAVIGQVAIASLPPFLTESFDARIQLAFPLSLPALALLAAIGSTLLGAWAAARRVLRTSPLVALQPDPPVPAPGWRATTVLAVGGVVAAGLAVLALLVFPDQRAIVAGPLLLCAALAGSAALTGPLTRAMAAGAGRARGPGLLAGVAIRRSPRRTWATTMTIAVTVAVGIAAYGAVRDVASVVSAPSLAQTDFYLKPTPAEVLPTDPVLPAELLQQVATVPGVREVIPNQAAYATLGEKRVILAGLSGGNAPAYARASEPAREAVRSGQGAIVSRGLARTLDLGIGDPLELPTALGVRRLPVADIVDIMSLEAGMVVLSLPQLERWYERAGETWLEVQLEPAADPAAVRAELERLASAYPTRIYVVSGAEELRGGEQAAQQAAALALVIQWMVTVAAALALLNTLLLSVLERRREWAVLRAIGASRRFGQRVVAVEGLVIGSFGCLVGLAIGAPLQLALTAGLSRAAAVAVPAELVSGSLLLVPVMFLVVMLAPLLAVRRAGRVEAAHL